MKKRTSRARATFLNRMVQRQALMHVNAFPGADIETLCQNINRHFPQLVVKSTDDFLNLSQHAAEREMQKFINGRNEWVVFVGVVSLQTALKWQPKVPAVLKVWLDVSIRDATENAIKHELESLCAHQREFIEIMLIDYFNLHHREKLWQPLHTTYRKLKYVNMSLSDIMFDLRRALSHNRK